MYLFFYSQIQELSRCAVEQTSLLLSNVYNLTENVGGEDGDKLDQAGVKVVGSAQVLLKTADVSYWDKVVLFNSYF